jgi:hypothetical protein
VAARITDGAEVGAALEAVGVGARRDPTATEPEARGGSGPAWTRTWLQSKASDLPAATRQAIEQAVDAAVTPRTLQLTVLLVQAGDRPDQAYAAAAAASEGECGRTMVALMAGIERLERLHASGRFVGALTGGLALLAQRLVQLAETRGRV